MSINSNAILHAIIEIDRVDDIPSIRNVQLLYAKCWNEIYSSCAPYGSLLSSPLYSRCAGFCYSDNDFLFNGFVHICSEDVL